MFPTLLFFITSTSGGQGDRKYDAMKSYLPVWLLVIALLCGVTRAEAFEVDGIYYDLNNEGAVVVPGDASYSGDVVIPASINYFGDDFPVVSIGDKAFSGCRGLTSITLPESLTSIGDWAFSGCSGLTSITLPESVTSIGDWAFSGCIGLTTITIPESVTSIGSYAFSYCDGLTTITLPESLKSIGRDTFFYCFSLASVTMGNSVTSIGNSAFSYCRSLTSITLPESVTSIGSDAFSGCSGLTTITIPESVTSIGSDSFADCTNLTSVTWNARDCHSGGSLFGSSSSSDNTRITTFTFGDQVEQIPSRLCQGMSGLTTITIPESVESIGSEAFSGCIGLTAMTVPESVTSIGDRAFDCVRLKSITWNARACSCGSNLFGGNYTRITTFTFGDQVEQIPAGLCSGLKGLTSITIPESVTSIGDEAFSGCSQLESVTVHAVTPPEVGPNTFDNYGIPLYVPAGCKEAYQAAEYWRNFMNINEFTSDVESVLNGGARIYVENHTLHVENVEGDYRVYTTTGQLVYEGHAATVQLADAGVYVVRTSSLSQKVMVK